MITAPTPLTKHTRWHFPIYSTKLLFLASCATPLPLADAYLTPIYVHAQSVTFSVMLCLTFLSTYKKATAGGGTMGSGYNKCSNGTHTNGHGMAPTNGHEVAAAEKAAHGYKEKGRMRFEVVDAPET